MRYSCVYMLHMSPALSYSGRYSTSNLMIHSKYAMVSYWISIWDCHTCIQQLDRESSHLVVGKLWKFILNITYARLAPGRVWLCETLVISPFVTTTLWIDPHDQFALFGMAILPQQQCFVHVVASYHWFDTAWHTVWSPFWFMSSKIVGGVVLGHNSVVKFKIWTKFLLT